MIFAVSPHVPLVTITYRTVSIPPIRERLFADAVSWAAVVTVLVPVLVVDMPRG